MHLILSSIYASNEKENQNGCMWMQPFHWYVLISHQKVQNSKIYTSYLASLSLHYQHILMTFKRNPCTGGSCQILQTLLIQMPIHHLLHLYTTPTHEQNKQMNAFTSQTVPFPELNRVNNEQMWTMKLDRGSLVSCLCLPATWTLQSPLFKFVQCCLGDSITTWIPV